MNTLLIIVIFLAVTLGPLGFLMLRSLGGKKRDQTPPPSANDDD